MKAEYTFTIEGEAPKDNVVQGLLHSGYIVATKRTFGEQYSVNVYGKAPASIIATKIATGSIDSSKINVSSGQPFSNPWTGTTTTFENKVDTKEENKESVSELGKILMDAFDSASKLKGNLW